MALVPKGCVYLLGDNREAAIDSRDFGSVKKTSLKYRVEMMKPRSKKLNEVPADCYAAITPTPVVGKVSEEYKKKFRYQKKQKKSK
ncbi:hypothetical protein L596_007140 [Steinernema carpocapsae]|uniref:Peptidase S26 domain-containing protein n=1 Tax=Steinernema carpocapsae TaxID=34508 RepID=A0A4U5P8E2_STECR|nr:hypothetical protein L596_007140 [Steinernema carpocapsae]